MKRIDLQCLLLALLCLLCACSAQPKMEIEDAVPSWRTQYDLGVRYLSEGNYKEAILAFEAAIEIDPKQPKLYLTLAQAYEQIEDYENTLRTLEDGIIQTDDQRLREYIWQVKVSLLEKPGAIEGSAVEDAAERVVYDPSQEDHHGEAQPEGYTRSVLLALDDVTPAVFRFVLPELTLHRYCVLPNGQIEDTVYQMDIWLDYCSCAELMLYYDERLDSYCCAYKNDISRAYTGAKGYYATAYILDDTEARLYRKWDQVRVGIWDDEEKYENNILDMTGAGWPYLDGVITNQKTLPYTYWMFKCESWISGGESAAEWRYSRRYWTEEELEAYEKEIRGEPRTVDFSKKTPQQTSNAADDASTKALLAYIDTLPTDVVSANALKIVDAYVDALNSKGSGEGIFYPDETNADQFWTAIYLFEVNQRKYFDENGLISWMINKEGFLIDSQQNVQDIANAIYGKVIDLPQIGDRWNVRQIDGDPNYYFGLSNRGAVEVVLDSFEQSNDGSAVLKLSYLGPPEGKAYLTAIAQMRVNPNVNYDGEIPFYYMIESVEIRYP